MNKLTWRQFEAVLNAPDQMPDEGKIATQRADLYDNGDSAYFAGYFTIRHKGFSLAEIREARENIARRH